MKKELAISLAAFALAVDANMKAREKTSEASAEDQKKINEALQAAGTVQMNVESATSAAARASSSAEASATAKQQSEQAAATATEKATMAAEAATLASTKAIQAENSAILADSKASQAAGLLGIYQALAAQGFRAKGNWDVEANVPDLEALTGLSDGDAYIVTKGGTTDVTGETITASRGDAFVWSADSEAWIYRPNATVPGPGTVTPEKTVFFDADISINLFDPNDSDVVSGYYLVTSTGQPTTANVSFFTTGFIEVEKGVEYFGGVNGSTSLGDLMRYVCEYDAGKNRLAGSNTVGRNSYTPSATGVKYIRVSTNKLSSISAYHINRGFLSGFTPWREPVYKLKPEIFPSHIPIPNDIVMPSKHYVLSGVQSDFFADAIMKRWRPYHEDVRFSGSAPFLRRLHRVASIKNATDGQTVITSLISRNDFLTKKEITTTLKVATPGTGEEEVKLQFLGDSWTYGGWYADALANYCPNVRLIGTRRAGAGNYNEGRGGWLLVNYMMRQDLPTRHNSFCQPSASGKYYWGSTGFWLNAWSVQKGTAGSGSEPTYSTGRYVEYLDWFDDSTGLKLEPSSGDIMYFTEELKYKEYDGEEWTEINYSVYTWAFNYPKYLEMYQLDTPDMLFVNLGINDWIGNNSPEEIDFSTWNSNMELLAASYLQAAPEGKLVICIPMSATGRMDNDSAFYTARRNAAMWMLRKNIIEHFDNREAEQIYILDTGVSIDGEHGNAESTNVELKKPFAGYTGDRSILIDTNQPHPIPNYPASGITAAAFIQYHRQ